jgi:hypothetical protein
MHHETGERASDDTIEVFVQVEGKRQISIVRVPASATVHDLIEEVVRAGLAETAHRGQLVVLLEDVEDELSLGDRLGSAGVKHRSRVHLHRCRQVKVAVHFNGAPKEHSFSPSASIAKVTKWAVGRHGFDLTPTDAVEHVLQITGSSDRPDEDVHLGTLTQAPACTVSFDLVPKRRVEG